MVGCRTAQLGRAVLGPAKVQAEYHELAVTSCSTQPAPASVGASIAPPLTEAVQLRPATPDDAAALALVGAATFLEAFTWMLPGADIVAHCAKNHTVESYQTYLAHHDTRITLAEAVPLGAPVGYGMLTAPELPSFPVKSTDIELKRIYLFSRFRSAATPVLERASDNTLQVVPGLRPGQALMNAAIQNAREMGRQRLLLGTHAGNVQAIQFYRKNGFSEAGTRTFQVGTQICCDLIFAKQL